MAVHIMGFNTWEGDMPADALVGGARTFADEVEAQGIARCMGAWIAPEQKMMWCTWDTDDLDALQKAFDAMNDRTGLKSELAEVDVFIAAPA